MKYPTTTTHLTNKKEIKISRQDMDKIFSRKTINTIKNKTQVKILSNNSSKWNKILIHKNNNAS
jgi:hypothetical protein